MKPKTYFDGKNFYDTNDFWQIFKCEYPGCEENAVGRVSNKQTFRYEMGYMKVCKKHLQQFKEKYGL